MNNEHSKQNNYLPINILFSNIKIPLNQWFIKIYIYSHNYLLLMTCHNEI
jgi:hypothetical protein